MDNKAYKITQLGEYSYSLVSKGKSIILKLPLPSNEQGLIGKITILLATLLLPLTNGITVFY